jgi:MOSC domain-containing protein YiiM
VSHLSRAELDAGLDQIRGAPADAGSLVLIVRRPRTNDREVLEEGTLDVERGLVGDRWEHDARAGARTHRDMQLNVMSARVIALIAPGRERWPLAGDQLFVDLDLSEANLPPGTRLSVGPAVIEVTAEPHTGCGKFVSRFGVDAMKFVNAPLGRELRLRGLNARVVTGGTVRAGDAITKLPRPYPDRPEDVVSR